MHWRFPASSDSGFNMFVSVMKKQPVHSARRIRGLESLADTLGLALDVPIRFFQADHTGKVHLDRNLRENPFCLILNRNRTICQRCCSSCLQLGNNSAASRAVSRFYCIDGALSLVKPVFRGGMFCGVLACGPVRLVQPTRERFQQTLNSLGQLLPSRELERLWRCYSAVPVCRVARVQALTRLLPTFARLLDTRSLMPTVPAEYQAPPAVVERAIQLIQSTGGGEKPLHNMARKLRVSPSYLSRSFHSALGVPLHVHVARLRVEQAKALLDGSSRKCIEVAMLSGFNSVSAFNRWFHKFTGRTPQEFRDILGKEAPALNPNGDGNEQNSIVLSAAA